MSDAAIHFYAKHYRVRFEYSSFAVSRPQYIPLRPAGDSCRYCSRGAATGATFSSRAHAVPELLGNRYLISVDECDSCNAHFSQHLDDHLAKFLGPGRTLSRIRGKHGVPQTGRSDRSHIRFKSHLEIHEREGDPIAELDLEGRELRIRMRREPYVPVAVFKAFAKMALATMPPDVLRVHAHLPRWLLWLPHDIQGAGFRPLQLWKSFVPGPDPIPGVRVLLLCRAAATIRVPGTVFVVAAHNYVFQIMLPALPDDLSLGEFEMPFFPVGPDLEQRFGRIARSVIDLGRSEVATEEQHRQVLRFESYDVLDRGI